MKINSSLFNISIINNVIEFDSTDSTNTRAREFAKRGSVHGSLFLAHKQTDGKGRMGRHFSSPMDQGIYMSLLLRPDIDYSRISNITLLAAVAIVRALEEHFNIISEIKWPNDIVIDGKKLVGILTEAGPGYIIIGIGINVNNSGFPGTIQNTATSIFLETGKRIDEFILIKSILSSFGSLYDEFISREDIEFILDEYNSRLVNLEKVVYIIPHDISDNVDNVDNVSSVDYSGLTPYTCCGIDKYGNLLCRDAAGEVTTVNSGEVSVRGAKGYV